MYSEGAGRVKPAIASEAAKPKHVDTDGLLAPEVFVDHTELTIT